MHRLIPTLALVAVVIFVAGTASALNQPTKGKSFKANVMVAYEECTAPDIVTDTGEPACSTPTPVDPLCGYAQTRGLGKIQLKALTIGNTGFRVKINKLEPNCEGNQIDFSMTVRRSGGHCKVALGQAGDCTVADFTQQFGSCIVTNGSCKASGKFQLSGGSDAGQIEVLELTITNVSHGGLRSFRTGLINGKP